MSKLPRLNSRKVITFLKTKGFQLDHATGSHFVFYEPTTKRRAVVSRHSGDLPMGTLLSIIREAGFTRKDLEQFF